MLKPKIYADFHNADKQGRLRLNCIGTLEDLAKQHVELREGLSLRLYSDDLNETGDADNLLANGVVSFSEDEHCWVAVIDWNAVRHESDSRAPRAKRNGSKSGSKRRRTTTRRKQKKPS